MHCYTLPIKWIRVPAEGAVLIRNGEIAAEWPDEIRVFEAASILGISPRRVRSMCDEGQLREGEDWRKQGTGRTALLILRRDSVLRLKGVREER